MAQRKNKERKQNLLKYKNQTKMSESKAPEMRPFRQVPNWQSTEKFELTGAELGEFYNFFNIFTPALAAFQQVSARGFKSGKITVAYEDMEGNAINDDEINQFTEKLNQHFQAENAKREAQGKVIDGDVPSENAKIVSFTGERLSKADVASLAAANESAQIAREGIILE
jgi:hypothetical protein